ncbi:MAG: F0F1 ATP synthase subunit B' [Alphaproteobacteria bacterium]|nr:F0F1 ATP synthase subunit B' [Alphaproteobacteria bacterium]
MLRPPKLRELAIAAGVLLAPALAFAQEAENKGMPQLDFGNPLTVSQIVWMAIIFFVLYLLLTLWALPQVDQVLAERSSRIAADLDTARSAKAAADAAVAELAEATRRAHAEAQAAIATALAEAKEAAAAEAAEFNRRLEAQLAAAEQRIAEARAGAMGALRQVAAETAQALLGQLTGRTPEPGALDAAIGAALAARGA